MPTVSKQTVNGVDYDIKDASARAGVAALETATADLPLLRTAVNGITDVDTSKYFVPYPSLITDTSVLSNANNALPNKLYRINNTSGTDILYLPAQIGQLITFANASASNFLTQFFFTADGGIYMRGRFNNNWNDWVNCFVTYPSVVTSEKLSDANNALPNTFYRINNNTETPIDNIPAQIGTLITYGFTANGNFSVQFFFDSAATMFSRAKFYNKWTVWKPVVGNDSSSATADIPLASTTKKIMLIGDSITQGQGSTGYVSYTKEISGTTYSIRGNGPDYPGAGPDYQVGTYLYGTDTRKWYEALDGHGWGQLLKAYYEDKFNCEVLNYGMSGINSGNLAGFIDSLVVDSDADIVIMMIGANNRNTTTTQKLYSDLISAGTKIIDSGKQLIIMSSSPCSVADETSTGRNYHMEDVEHINYKVANALGCQFISVYEEFMDYCEFAGVTIDSLLADGLHPNDAGHEVIFKIVTKYLGLNRKRPGATW